MNDVLNRAYGLEEPTPKSLVADIRRLLAILNNKIALLEVDNARLKAENDELRYGDSGPDPLIKDPIMTSSQFNELVTETHELKSLVLEIHPDSKLQHLIHILIGYRESVITYGENTRPFTIGSAAEMSWKVGRQLAESDLIKRANNRRRS